MRADSNSSSKVRQSSVRFVGGSLMFAKARQGSPSFATIRERFAQVRSGSEIILQGVLLFSVRFYGSLRFLQSP